MDPLGIIGGAVGIVSLGIQLSQILQQQMDDVVHADEKLSKFVIEIHSTAFALSQLTKDLACGYKVTCRYCVQRDGTNSRRAARAAMQMEYIGTLRSR